MKYPIGMTLNRTWLAFANKKRCIVVCETHERTVNVKK